MTKNNIPFFDISRQYQSIKAEIESEIIAFLPTCNYIGGKTVTQFENKMAEQLGVKHVISCGNGTDALVLALKSAGVCEGDEVITTPFSFFATSEAIAYVGAIPVFADIRKSDLNIDPSKIEALITDKTKAIIPVHIFGAPCAMDEINSIAKKHHLFVIEDACQAIGASYKGKEIGSLGDMACFSFYPTKNLGAFGDGGAVSTNNDELACLLRAYKTHGSGQNGAKAFSLIHQQDVSTLLPKTQGDHLYDPCKYYNFVVGGNSRLDAIQALVLSIKLPYLKQWNKRRNEISKRYQEAFSTLPLTVCMQYEENSKSACHQFVVLSNQREALTAYLKEKGIGTGDFYPVPLHKQIAHAHSKIPSHLPVVEEICEQSFCLPVYPELTNQEQEYIIDEVRAFFETK